jgi:hypothetical protein
MEEMCGELGSEVAWRRGKVVVVVKTKLSKFYGSI